MPVEFAPPVQGAGSFNVQPAQSTDPLQTLAEMGQIKQQAMQTQQMQMDMQSQQGFMKAYLEANGDLDQTIKLAPQYGVLPKDIYSAKEMMLKAAQEKATLDKTTTENHNLWRGQMSDLYKPLLDETNPAKQADLAATLGQNAINQGLVTPDTVFKYTDPQSAKLYLAGINSDEWLAKRAAAMKEDADRQKAQAELPGIATKNEETARANTASQLASATDPASYDAIRDRYIAEGGKDNPQRTGTFPSSHQVFDQNNQWLPGMQGLVNRTGLTSEQRQQAVPKTEGEFLQVANDPSRSPAERQSAKDALQQMAEQRRMESTSQWPQFIYKYAQGLKNPDGTPKTPAQLTMAELNQAQQNFKVFNTDPNLEAMRGIQQSMAFAQLASMPTEQGILDSAKELVNGDFSPDQIKDLRSGRVSGGPRIIEAARAYAQANNIPFSLANLEIQANTRADTETKFATGPEAQMVRSFDNLMQHTALLDQARKALPGSNLPVLKSIANALGVASGDTAQKQYDLIADFVAKESAKAFVAGGGGEAERAQTYSNFSRNLGDAQIKSNIKALMDLADAQRQGLERQYQEGTYGKGPRLGRLFSNQALQARDQLMGKPPAAAGPSLTIRVGSKFYKYNGSGDKKDLNNYTEIKTQ